MIRIPIAKREEAISHTMTVVTILHHRSARTHRYRQQRCCSHDRDDDGDGGDGYRIRDPMCRVGKAGRGRGCGRHCGKVLQEERHQMQRGKD